MVLKSPAEIEIMDQANRIIRGILDELSQSIRPGMTTMEIDAFAEKRIREAGGVPAFKGYPHRGDGNDFPGTVCAARSTHEVVHGIPSPTSCSPRATSFSIDMGVLYKGYYGDGARTYPVGRLSGRGATSCSTSPARRWTWGIEQVTGRQPGLRHRPRGAEHVEAVRFLGGARVRRPRNRRRAPRGSAGAELRRARGGASGWSGVVLAIEPMVNAAGPRWCSARRTAGPRARATAVGRRISRFAWR